MKNYFENQKFKKPNFEKQHIDPEALALTAIQHILPRIDEFIGETGACLDQLKETLATPETLAAILDFLLNHEDLLASLCQTENLEPEQIWSVRRKLPGAPQDILFST